MRLDRWWTVLYAAMAGVFLILGACAFAIEMPIPTGIWIPMMRMRTEPLSNCEFNGFTIYLHSDGSLTVVEGEYKERAALLSGIREARDSIRDDTTFVIADRDVSYGDLVSLVADIHAAAPADHLAVVTRVAQVEGLGFRTRHVWADRCKFEWPAVRGQPRWEAR
jgi:biopolymer transport protein ExbD